MIQTGMVLIAGQQVPVQLLRTAAAVGPELDRTVRTHGAMLEAAVKRNASGRPGPRVITGAYRRSIVSYYDSSGGMTFAFTVGTNAPQGARLEYGFHGVDSLGRNYNQPPYPHFGPAIDWLEPQFEKAVGDVVDRALAAGL
jgi:hypothetical protein